MINWDWIISAGILIVLVLAVWAKVSRQTIPDLIRNIVDAIRGGTEDTGEYVQEMVMD
jgi:hypothetical protein